ncbi:hypothetical protein [Mesorhizobium sp. WSM2239]|uniref:Uncharacterized protein n=2 Tax=unclassified Mesorhizobium TaxID=325217 RepID=A0AAU8D810_9HYPH
MTRRLQGRAAGISLWEAKTMPLDNQLGGIIYFLPSVLGLLVAVIHRKSGA